MVAAIGAGEVFSKGRDFAAWLGLVPKQISTGDRTILGKISVTEALKLATEVMCARCSRFLAASSQALSPWRSQL
jgi:transposase